MNNLTHNQRKSLKAGNKKRDRSLFPVALILALLWSGYACEPDDHGQDHEHGVVEFSISCDEEAQEEFEIGLAHLHHMMYEQARPHFEAAAEADSECAMAHWGIAMTSFYPLWMPTPDELLERGQNAVANAREIGAPTEREEAYIAAVEAFFNDPEPSLDSRAEDHEARVRAWKQAQREVYETYTDDVDAAALYALAEVCYAQTQFSPDEDADYTRQREAGALLERFWEDHPEHPGLFHYIIHAYDSPELAEKAVEAAEGYDQIAPDTPHALHMPSHIFVRLGHWEETVDWNIRSADAALRQADHDSHAKLHYVHALDYKMYGYLQKGDEENARETLDKVMAVETLPDDMVSGYGVAAAIARYHLELQKWEEAAQLEVGVPEVVSWEEFPENMALFHYARGLGAARTGDLDQAEAERELIQQAASDLHETGNSYWAYMSDALGKAVEAWTLYERGDTEQALNLMSEAADLEDSMDKHPVSPGEVLPVRELYGELLLKEGRQDEARAAFEASLERTPNRLNALRFLEEAELAAASTESESDVAGETAFTRDPDDPAIEWGPCPDFMPESCELAVIQGDPAEPNADVLFKMAPNTTVDDHWHTSTERMVLLSGDMTVDYEGQEPVSLEPGTYAYGPAGQPHETHCGDEGDCILFIAFEDHVDALPADEEETPGWDKDAFTMTTDEAQFADCPPFMPESCGLAVIQGDPEERNADVFFKMTPDTKVPMHWHTSAERMVLVSGQMEVNYEGQEPVTLDPFTYAYGPSELPHETVCVDQDEDCVLFIAFEEPVDAHEARVGDLQY